MILHVTRILSSSTWFYWSFLVGLKHRIAKMIVIKIETLLMRLTVWYVRPWIWYWSETFQFRFVFIKSNTRNYEISNRKCNMTVNMFFVVAKSQSYGNCHYTYTQKCLFLAKTRGFLLRHAKHESCVGNVQILGT